MTTSTTKTVKLDHIACGVPSIDAAIPLLEGTLGARPHRGGPNPEFRGAQWAFEGGGILELIEPLGPDEDNFLRRFLRSRGPGIHHVTLKVPDIRAARANACNKGYEVIGFNDTNPSWKECFLHPKQALGLVIQMAEADPDIESDTWVGFAPTLPGREGPAATLLGLRLAVRSLDAASRLWCDAGCATSVQRQENEAVFAWEGSPLTLHVIETDAYPEGPIGLEVQLPQGMLLEENPPPAIGAVLIF